VTTDATGGRAFVRCDTCQAESMTISNDNRMKAQRVATNFWGWRVYNEGGLWKHACPKCLTEWLAKHDK